MSILAKSYASFSKVFFNILLFSLFVTFTFDAFSFITGVNFYPPGFPHLTFGTDLLTNAIKTLQSGVGLNIIVALPTILVSIGLILLQVVLNAILLINYIISLFISIVLVMVQLPPETISTIAGILAWILEAPIIFGFVMELGQVLYTIIWGKQVL